MFDWKYDPMDEHGIFRTGVSLNGKCKSARVFINVREDSFLVHSVPSCGADANCLHEVAEFITRANYGMMKAEFGMMTPEEAIAEIEEH